jgi:hypothetical protein
METASASSFTSDDAYSPSFGKSVFLKNLYMLENVKTLVMFNVALHRQNI